MAAPFQRTLVSLGDGVATFKESGNKYDVKFDYDDFASANSSSQAAKGASNIIPDGKLANHLFKGAGKLADNPANRTLIQNISNGNPLGVDAFGKSWYTGVDAAGKSIYTYTQNGIIKGAGYMNMSPAEMVIKYGLK